jgi:hypothetical protein
MVKQESKDVYFVWTKTGRRPTRAHNDSESACNEAQRLAELCPGKKFLVLHATHKFSALTQGAAHCLAAREG